METILVTELEFAKAAEVFRDTQGVRCEPAAAGEAGLGLNTATSFLRYRVAPLSRALIFSATTLRKRGSPASPARMDR